MPNLSLTGVTGIPLVETGDDVAGLIARAIESGGLNLMDGDVLVITSKIISKAEGRWVDLDTITPDEEAHRVAAACGKDPRLVSVILGESERISRMRKDVLVTEHRLGFVSANAGVDHSNTRPDGNWLLLLPRNPDQSARSVREQINRQFGVTVAVVISDSHGRPFRWGTVGVAIGAAGLPALWDWRGRPDLFGRALQVTEVAFADELAAAAGLVLGQAAEAVPVVIVRGLDYPVDEHASAADLNRPRELDLYR
jgi:coenzyme F420-0:L-glutamate ligase/coenzyme F420-1:gamma-L-glutamate ligase